MDFKITEVYISSGHLVVTAEHYNANGSLWFVEHYTWQGREGLKQKRATNALGQLLLDDGTVAPVAVRRGPLDELVAFLPPGRNWLRQPAPHLVDDSILGTIRSIHKQRLATGWPQGKVDTLRTFKPAPTDHAGVAVLLAKFRLLVGRTE